MSQVVPKSSMPMPTTSAFGINDTPFQKQRRKDEDIVRIEQSSMASSQQVHMIVSDVASSFRDDASKKLAPKHKLFLEDSPAEKLPIKLNTSSPKRKAPLKVDSFIEEKQTLNIS